jgi:hypothetical protein
MQCRDVELAIEQEGLGPFSEATRSHLSECSACRDFVEDLTAIVSTAEKFPKEIEPPARVWASLRNQLEAEGLIKEAALPAGVSGEPWWQGFANPFRGRAFATAAVGLVIVVAAVFQLRTDRQPSSSASTGVIDAQNASAVNDPLLSSGQALVEQERDLNGMLRAGSAAQIGATADVDAALRSNLKQLDEFIAECERHLKESPNDELAREYLAAAYQQKAELLSAMIDRGRSVN